MADPSFLTPTVDRPEIAVGEWIALQAEMLIRAVAGGEPDAAEVLRFAQLESAGRRVDGQSARLAIAKDHWYVDWADAVAHGEDRVDTRFERAADAVHEGDLDALERLLDAGPDLVRMRSPFPHAQTLLHHVAANGVEVERQLRPPANSVEVLRLLIRRGADPDATCGSYGGGNGSTPLCLIVSSIHPYAAGVQTPLVEELVHHGARVDGIDDDGLPLWTALTSGYTDAAEALAHLGARVDNICLAAALGDLEAVCGYLDPTGVPDRGTPSVRIGTDGPILEPDRLVEYALIWAAAHGRRPVVEFLLTRDPDLRVTEPLFGSTALGMARHRKHEEVATLLERHRGSQ